MRKFVAAVVLVVIALPLYSVVKPKPFDPQVYFQSLRDAGITVSELRAVESPELESVEHYSFRVNGDMANLYRFDDRGKLAKQMSYQQPDSGSVLVESMGLREALGAAPNPNKRVGLAKNGMWMVVVMSNDDDVRNGTVAIFERQ